MATTANSSNQQVVYAAKDQLALTVESIEPKTSANGNEGYYIRFKGLRKGTYIDKAVQDGGTDRLGNDHGEGRGIKVNDKVMVNRTPTGDFRLSSVSYAARVDEARVIASSSMSMIEELLQVEVRVQTTAALRQKYAGEEALNANGFIF